jgi:hypothetical protein
VNRHALELGVRGHHAREAGEPDGRLEWTGVHVVKLARSDRGRGHVLAGVGHGIAEEVLGADQHALAQVLALHAAREGDAHGAHEIGVLAVGLGHPPPARIAGDVHDGRQGMEHPHRPHLASHDIRHLLDGRRVPRRRNPIAVGNAVKPGDTTPFRASLWTRAGILRRVSVTR